MPWIDLAETKLHLNKTATTDDVELLGFIDAACSVIEDLKGHVDPVTVTESQLAAPVTPSNRPHWWGWSAWWRPEFVIPLREAPVESITSVTWLSGGTSSVIAPNTDPSDPYNGWYLNENVLHLPQRGEYTVVYTAGLATVPANYRLAALELVAHLWRQSQLNQNSGRPSIGGDQMEVMPRVASALPYRVRELLGIYGEITNEYVVIG